MSYPSAAYPVSNDEFVSDWLGTFNGATTQTTYGRVSDRFLQFLADTPLRSVTPEQVQQFVRELTDDPELSANSIRTYKTALRSFLRFVAQQGVCDPQLFEMVQIEQPARLGLPDIYVDFSRDRVISDEPDARNRAILWLAIALRCPINDLLKLTWFDVNVERAAITLRNAQAQSYDVLLQDPIWSDLISLRQNRNLDEYVFHGKKGTGLNYNQVQRVIAQSLKRAGVNASPSEVCASPNRKERRDYILL